MALRKKTYKNGKSVWVIDFYRGKKRCSKTIGSTSKRKAERIYNRFMADLRDEKFGIIEPKKITVNAFIPQYIKSKAVEKAESTISREKRILRHFCSVFENHFLLNIGIDDIESYRRHRLKSVSAETVNLEFRHLKAIFNWALEQNYVKVNPFKAFKALKTPESAKPRFFELNDIEKIREAFQDDEFEFLVEFFLLTGARLKEPLVLTWDNVDFIRKQLMIPSLHTKAKKNRIISFRKDKKLESLLENLPRRADNFLFGPLHGGKQWTADWVSKKISYMLTKIGFEWASCHTFRHTYISHLLMDGVPLQTVRDLVGHGSITTTMNYAHLADSHKAEMQAKRPY